MPVFRSYKRDKKAIRKFVDKTFPSLRRKARNSGAVIYFIDESCARVDLRRGRTWAIVGKTPEIEHSGDRFSVNLIGALSLQGAMYFSSFIGSMNSSKFIEFLEKLRADAGKPIFVIADGASYHTSRETSQFLRGQKQIHLVSLPAYAPEMNPVEQIWNTLKRRIGALFIASKAQLQRKVHRIMLSIQKSKKLIRSFFELEYTSYARV
jgi:transposase